MAYLQSITRMEGEILPSALTFRNGAGMGDPQMVHDVPPAKYLDEIRVGWFVQSVLRKPDWSRKMLDESVWTKWEEETRLQEPRFRDEMFAYAKKELKFLSECQDEQTGIGPTGIDLVWKSDTLLPQDLRTRFNRLISEFENSIPLDKRDWHPGSGGRVLNLIHPSMYCLVYGQSVDHSGKPVSPPIPRREEVKYPNRSEFATSQLYFEAYEKWRIDSAGTFWSHRFQWLPAEFLISPSGQVKIASYINSLPPFGKLNQDLYLVIAEIFERAIPLVNIVLTDLRNNFTRNRFEDYDYVWWPHGKPELCPELAKEQEWVGSNEWYSLSYEEQRRARESHDKKVIEWYARPEQGMTPLPIPEFDETEFIKCPLDEVRELLAGNERVDIHGRKVQVIVKIGSIQLTPENPTFDGGNWHVEGMANEKIVATVIYYYDSKNIKDDELHFRQAVDLPWDDDRWEQDDTEGAVLVYGIDRGAAMVQDAGKISTPEGRVVCFPNVYQHRVSSFSLADKTKPGHRKILVFFLVDPFSSIPSTADIPPQEIDQPVWRNMELEAMMLERFPPELVDAVQEHNCQKKYPNAKWGFTREEALQNRLDLMAERSKTNDAVDSKVFQREFNLCEH